MRKQGRLSEFKEISNRINNHIDCKVNKMDINQIEGQLRVAKWRFETDYPIWKVIHFSYEQEQKEKIISKMVYEIPQIYFHHRQKKLSLVNGLYCLKTIFMACQGLVEQFGFFRVKATMIGISYEKECKIWVNDKFWENCVMEEVETEEQMIDSIIDVMEGHMSMSRLSSKLISSLRKEKHTIVKMIQLIWKFSYENRILIPPFFETEQNNALTVRKNHKKTRSQKQIIRCEITKQNKIKRQNQFDVQTNKTKKKEMEVFSGTHEEFLNSKERSTLQLHKSGDGRGRVDQIGTLTSRIRSNSKSDFISRQLAKRRVSLCPTVKQHLVKSNRNKIPESQKTSPQRRERVDKQNGSNEKMEQNKQKMKEMVQQKVKLNRERKKLQKMQTINTVKSIGQFMDNEKKILDESAHLQYLHEMGRKIENSYLNMDQHDIHLDECLQSI